MIKWRFQEGKKTNKKNKSKTEVTLILDENVIINKSVLTLSNLFCESGVLKNKKLYLKSVYKTHVSLNIKSLTLKTKPKKKVNIFVAIVAGIFIGFINGFWGGGGGMLCVPALTSIFKLEKKTAHATTMLVILPLSIASFLIYMFNKSIDFSSSWYIVPAFFVGGAVGAVLLKKANNTFLQLFFAIIIIIGGIRLLI